MSSLPAGIAIAAAAISIAAGAACAADGAAAASSSLASDMSAIDPSARPGDDFYRYANGPWLRTTTRPDGVASYDTTTMLREENARRVRDLVQQAADGGGRSSGVARKVGDYYATWMDAAGIEAKGLAPISNELAAIDAIADRKALSAYLGGSMRLDDGTNSHTESLLGVWIHQSFDRSDRYAPHLMQGGLGLPDRDDYLDPSPASAERRNLYQAHVAAMLNAAGLSDPDGRAARVLALETAIARTHASAEDTADVFNTDNPWRRADFDAKAPGMDWAAYFKAAGLSQQADFVLWQPGAVVGAGALVASQPLEAWRDYLRFHLIEHHADVLPNAFSAEHMAFAGRLSGAQQAPDRTKQALAATDAALGAAVGQLYVARYFPPQAKAAAEAMAENLRTAYRARIAGLAWMSPETKAKAQTKLAALKIGLGYPDSWTDYSALAIVRGDAAGNLRRAEAFAYRRELAKLKRPVDPAEWPLALVRPQMVGAIINFSPNAMQFSAGVLQPPYFDYAGDAAANYGSAGAGMAHEFSHSFDELGAIYDDQGRLVRWWTAQDLARYRAAWAPLAAQFDAYCPKPGLCVNGRQVQSENIGDLTGLVVAHDAYHLSLNGRPDVVKDALTGDQRFFLAFARRWRKLQSDAALRQQIATDTHAPGEYRSDTVRNLEAWRRAFDVRPGDKLYLPPEARVQVW